MKYFAGICLIVGTVAALYYRHTHRIIVVNGTIVPEWVYRHDIRLDFDDELLGPVKQPRVIWKIPGKVHRIFI